ncbi:MAG: hypothetical protein A3C08_02030 [Candidatus Taylorbacteria bacterium RIFCSPHIGHO2_02_FULL_47_18]|uniref:Prepilin-type N-terminal cleavage/methylation domain-containing protein n=1 Tax=Candidatus Taylorbacteria bacterium RIFCSPLOWO2_01_FULL_48_100 TaxID=1802322 RepID=A0A1G2NF42_9BACT|nr:MAG: hypothetical protein A2670_02730 [Candidatus Taylorbacteria bacterium RIFCSPHIGHO2_01_FULL_48_38]OHA28517.1 MAG: hypothetical protein A3C08_02030 [Candidatus Taylorbacteria bacterium RIFCSPHIGHO2_02_FULL_47_18]OHA34676.1 MAG: hypothetical protein A2938_00305 [Candidatus Taylorbacteria bacterium RIFCSPLOWO2_01_FULL_48_100]OHA40744.1 MAG: hypothetical protein A3J31_00325 [Candidatus Taylorbacteria bacterium RIFCSPLOWO2_02_FULL_48_16]OHA45394.1 MAG: hypothetical protein A3H13_01110 [Candid
MKRQNKNGGFTLIEMIMSVAVFTVVALIAAGALLAIADANRKAQAFKSVVNNLNFALESVARNLRTGSGYSSSDFSRGDCSLGYTDGISFISQDGERIEYYINETQIIRKVANGNPIGVTAPEVQVDRFCFFIAGTGANDDEQPRALMLVGGFMQEKPKLKSRFDIQTFITQRLLDS